MELDEKIEENKMPLTCFHTDEAKQFVNAKGYFHNYLESFSNLSYCTYGTMEVNNDETATKIFHLAENDHYYKFFLPDIWLKKKEKKLRPYLFKEFLEQFPIGSVITFRRKAYTELIYNRMFIGYGEDNVDPTLLLLLGNISYTLEELFNEYEWKAPDTVDFQPFGVEE